MYKSDQAFLGMTTPNLFSSLGKSLTDIFEYNQDRQFIEYSINVKNEVNGKLITGTQWNDNFIKYS